jgi:hypothetical protein
MVVAARRMSSVKVATSAFSPNGSAEGTFAPALAGTGGAAFPRTGADVRAFAEADFAPFAAAVRDVAPRAFAGAVRAGFFGFFCAIFQ